jgi:hypothetical protein
MYLNITTGTRKSGKSVLLKQLKVIQDHGGYSYAELKEYSQIIFQICVTQMKIILEASQKLNMTVEKSENMV